MKLQADKPKVIVVGDGVVDSHIYDMRTENTDLSQGWTSPLSRDDWYYAEGFDTRQCLAGATAIHAMLWANGVPTAGNTFPTDSAFCKPQTGSTFVLRQRANAGKTERTRSRAYLTKTKKGTWSEILAAGYDSVLSNPDKHPLAGASANRDKTWRVAVNLLSKSGLDYVDSFEETKRKYDAEALRAICLWDIGRGSFHRGTGSDEWKEQQIDLFKWYKTLCNTRRKPSILIRTSDPDRFELFLEQLANETGPRPIVILVCALAHIGDGDLRGSGTWSGIWAQAYDHLNEKKQYLVDSTKNDWRFHMVIPVYEDGVIWIGPKCWPIGEEDQTDAFLHADKQPIGRLFMVPGTQPGLSEFEEHSRVIGVHALMTYALIEHLADQPADSELAPAIKQGLIRARRLRSHGYCTPDELIPIEDSSKTFYINYPGEIWKKDLRAATDSLLDIRNALLPDVDEEHLQTSGPYEAKCKVDYPADAAGCSPASLRIFHTMEKVISNDFVGSPQNCNRIIGDIRQEKDILDRLKHKKIKDHWIEIGDQLLPLDSFAREEVESFTLRQRISMQFGNFAMADPKEAARILDLAQRVRQHVLINRHNAPEKGKVFNFALFGSPGSGKSFLAREIERLIDPKGEIFSPDEFNLSQFTEPAQLTRALGGVASKSVGGKVPLVLWDEFDSVLDERRGGWLSRFLMPMQDAHFFDGSQRRPIGTAVFVFIGGTFATADDFRDWACQTTKKGDPPSESVLLKARDFHSRLYTALDMPSIIENHYSDGIQYQKFMTTWKNSYPKLARAVLLRKYFRDNCKIGETVFLHGVKEDLCRFLLAIPLRHGARSLERIVEACVVSKPSHVSMLHLPPDAFLEEHIETKHVHRDSGIGKMSIGEMREACR